MSERAKGERVLKVEFTGDEAEAVLACLARGKSVLEWRRELELAAYAKLAYEAQPVPDRNEEQ